MREPWLGKVRHESKYLAIEYFHTEKNWSIGWMCKHLEVARAAYYKWLHRETPEDEMENIKLAELIKEYDERFSHILGYRRMTPWGSAGSAVVKGWNVSIVNE